MDIEQAIFKRLLNAFSRLRGSKEVSRDGVKLDDLHAKLSLIARIATGESMDVVCSEREGGWSDAVFFLPRSLAIYDELQLNASLYLFRVLYLSVQKRMGLNWGPGDAHSVSHSQAEAKRVAPLILEELFKEYPGLEEIHSCLVARLPSAVDTSGELLPPDFSWLYGRFMKNSQEYSDKKLLEHLSLDRLCPQPDTWTTEIEAQCADEVELCQVDKQTQQDYVLTHNFEKVETVSEFNGIWRDFDGDDDLNEQAEALSEYNLKHLVRVDEPVHSLYRAQFRGNPVIAESKAQETTEFHVCYPEWDYQKRDYRNDYCKVFPKLLKRRSPDYTNNTISGNGKTLLELQKTFAQINNERTLVRRQVSGDAVDLDAVIDLRAGILAQAAYDERCYLQKRQVEKELSLLLLLDMSLSSDGYVRGNRIADVEKQVSILLGEVLDGCGVDFQVDSFYSKTRSNTSYITLKGFEEPWALAKDKVGSIQPQGYTRIGTAIRHARRLIQARPGRKKWIILLSDGKPNDYDRYEGRYGIEDIKQSLRELKADKINSFALAIEEQAKYYLPQIFGRNRFSILSGPTEMIEALTRVYRRIRTS